MLLREWTGIFIVLGFMGLLILITKYSEIRSSSTLIAAKEEHKIVIHLSGALEAPGDYYCSPGTTMKDLLKQVRLLPEADRKKISFKKILFSSQTIEIPKRKKKFSKEFR